MKLLLATTSQGKLREQRACLRGVPVELHTLESWPDLAPPEEPGPEFSDNAAAKALYYQRATGMASIGEDAGLVIDALDGEPGVHSARWLGAETPYDVKNLRVLELLDGVPTAERTARYISAVALADHGRVAFACEESCEGLIASAASGTAGFGYDPIFFHPELGRTLASVTADEKRAVSHRGKAMAKLAAYLRRELPARAGAR